MGCMSVRAVNLISRVFLHQVGMPGPITRLLACSPDKLKECVFGELVCK